MSFLNEVLKEKRVLVKDLESRVPLREIRKMANGKEKRPFFEKLSQRFPDDVKIIAEVKKASPSRGTMASDLDLQGLVKDYERGGAAAVSIITEENHFKGSLGYITEARKVTSLPLLRKDFIVDEYELFQTKAAGADAVLLIGEALGKMQIAEYLEIAKSIDLDVLMEVHSMKTFDKIADFKGFILGINNRDLKSLKVDLSVSYEILEKIPADCPVVVESGIEVRKDIETFMERGVSGFLIGTALVLSTTPYEKLMELRGKDGYAR